MLQMLKAKSLNIYAFSKNIVGLTLLTSTICTNHIPAFAQSQIDADQTFKQYQQKAQDFEHTGNKKKAIETIQSAMVALKSLPPYCDHMSQLRARLAGLQLQNKLEKDGFSQAEKLATDSSKVAASAANDGDLWLEIGYLKDLLLKYAQDNDSLKAFELADKINESYKQLRTKPRDTLEPLCESCIRHKNYTQLEAAAKKLLADSDDPLSRMKSLSMLQLSYVRQAKKKEAAQAFDQLNKLDPKTRENERVWHRDMAVVKKSILSYDEALKEIKLALALDEKLPKASKPTQLATDFGIKAAIECASGNFEVAIKDAKLADKLWGECDPSIWKSQKCKPLAMLHNDSLAVLEQALRGTHRDDEAEVVRLRRRQIQYVR